MPVGKQGRNGVGQPSVDIIVQLALNGLYSSAYLNPLGLSWGYLWINRCNCVTR